MFLNSSLTSSNVTSFPPAFGHNLPALPAHSTNGWASFRVSSLKLNCLQLVSRGTEHPLSLPTLPAVLASLGRRHLSWYLPGRALLSLSLLHLTAAATGTAAWLRVWLPKIGVRTQRVKESPSQTASVLQNGDKCYLLSASSA